MGTRHEHRALRGLSPAAVQGTVQVLLPARTVGGQNGHVAVGPGVEGTAP